jgi:hypothetical protein
MHHNKIKAEKTIRIPITLTQKLDKISLVEFRSLELVNFKAQLEDKRR